MISARQQYMVPFIKAFSGEKRNSNRIFWQQIVERIHVGNVYVNRNQIGAIVGSQPFGGEGAYF